MTGGVPWDDLLPHYAELVRLARRHLPPHAQASAEDVVHDALLRARGLGEKPPDQVGAWLNVTVRRLCIDGYRRDAVRDRVAGRLAAQAQDEPGVDELVCDRAEASWLAAHVQQLPPRQRRALVLRADGLPPADVAVAMAVTTKTADSLLSRARLTLRAVAAGALGVLAAAFAGVRRTAPAAPVVALAGALTLLPALAPDRDGPAPDRTSDRAVPTSPVPPVAPGGGGRAASAPARLVSPPPASPAVGVDARPRSSVAVAGAVRPVPSPSTPELLPPVLELPALPAGAPSLPATLPDVVTSAPVLAPAPQPCVGPPLALCVPPPVP